MGKDPEIRRIPPPPPREWLTAEEKIRIEAVKAVVGLMHSTNAQRTSEQLMAGAKKFENYINNGEVE